MKYKCGIIKDLLPMYIEDLCSEDSKNAVEQHINECDDCRSYFESIKSNDYTTEKIDNEPQLHSSLKNVKRQIKLKHIFTIAITIIVMLAFTAISYVAAIGLSYIDYPILYENNITIDQNLPEDWENYGNKYAVHCKGQVIEGILCKELMLETENGTEKALFFQLTTNKLYDLITTKNHVSHQPFSDIEYYDKIYYYPGHILEDLAGIAEGEMEHILSVSTLLIENN